MKEESNSWKIYQCKCGEAFAVPDFVVFPSNELKCPICESRSGNSYLGRMDTDCKVTREITLEICVNDRVKGNK
jgi:hypothetical protein